MNYAGAVEYLENLSVRGIKPGLESVKTLAELVGNPQDKLKFIHVAGTNGKGSTSTYIASILSASGYKVGSYESPAVFEDTEIIRVNGKNVSKSIWAEEITNMAQALEGQSDLTPTRFEFETVLAMLIFLRKGCDFVVLECGMGGLLDATNFVESTEVCVFTPIGIDHCAFLGDTLKEIAENKAGIIKKGSVAVSSAQDIEVEETLTSVGQKKECRINFVCPDNISKVKTNLQGSSFDYKGIKGIKINPIGKNQIENACLAIEAILALRERGENISDKAIIKGLTSVQMPGRFEVVCSKPLILLDGGHNVPAAVRLKENIENYLAGKKIIYILSMLKDKEYDKVVGIMCPLASHVITATSPNKARALESYELAKSVYEVNPMVTAADSIDEAVELSLLMADKDTAIVVWGSLSHLKEVRKCVENRKDIKTDNHGIEAFYG